MSASGGLPNVVTVRSFSHTAEVYTAPNARILPVAGRVRIGVVCVSKLSSQSMKGRPYTGYFPEVQATPWGSRDMSILDPFGNRIVFTTDAESN
ncbi:glyoxalase superfamily protein [Herbaspirillum frisingense]|uniref:glyoxalase superfamily protein n=1 Tax=Herbaspirillum frisingense TaxID=92645 RepID=UPI003084296D